jgi:ComF family protein
VIENLINLFYPQTCAACETPLLGAEKQLCLDCLASLPIATYKEHANNRLSNVFMGRVPFKKVNAYLHFYKGGLTQKILHQLKYKNNPSLGAYLGHMLAEHYDQNDFLKGIDCIMPIPLHPKKLKKRGYNQSEYLANGISEQSGIPVNHALKRVEYSETQTRKNRYERWLNVETVFTVESPESLKGKHILLIDDVLTTGATLEAAALPLLTIKDVDLSALTLATAD